MPRRPPRASNGPGDTATVTTRHLRHGLAATGLFVAAVLVAIGVPAVAVGVVAGETARDAAAKAPLVAVRDIATPPAGPDDEQPITPTSVRPFPSPRFAPATASGWYGPTAPGDTRRAATDDPSAPAGAFGLQAGEPADAPRHPEATLPFDESPAASPTAVVAGPTAVVGAGAPAAPPPGPVAGPVSGAPVAPAGPAPAPGPVPSVAPPPSAVTSPSPTPAGPSASQVVATFVALVNGERIAAGLAPLAVDAGLAAAAQAQADRMAAAGVAFHQDLAAVAGLGWSAVGENVGHGYDPAGLHQAFLASPGHRANVLGAAFTHLGVGVVVAGDGSIWVAEVVAG